MLPLKLRAMFSVVSSASRTWQRGNLACIQDRDGPLMLGIQLLALWTDRTTTLVCLHLRRMPFHPPFVTA